MIGIEELDALDLTIWLGRGAAAASRLGCTQSTISRRSNQCLQVFDLRLHRDDEGWPRVREHDLLLLERQVHQLHRLRRGSGLRLDASLLAAPLLAEGTPCGWICGGMDALGWRRPMRLLEERVLDAWITAMGQELATVCQTTMLCIPLLITPLQLACSSGHPLLRETRLRLEDVAGLPRLAPRAGSYPRTERLLGPWRQDREALQLETGPRRRPTLMDLPAPEPVLHYGTRFSLAHQTRLQALPIDLGVQSELTLVMRRDVCEEAAMLELVDTLQRRGLQAARLDLGSPGRN